MLISVFGIDLDEREARTSTFFRSVDGDGLEMVPEGQTYCRDIYNFIDEYLSDVKSGRCPSCGAEVTGEGRFCASCGAKLK